MTLQKPTFEVSPDGRTVDVDGTHYLLEPIISEDWRDIRDATCEDGFRVGTFGENVRLYLAALHNQNNPISEPILRYVESAKTLTGDTRLFGAGDLFWARDSVARDSTNRRAGDLNLVSSLSYKQGELRALSSEDGKMRMAMNPQPHRWFEYISPSSSILDYLKPTFFALTGDINVFERIKRAALYKNNSLNVSITSLEFEPPAGFLISGGAFFIGSAIGESRTGPYKKFWKWISYKIKEDEPRSPI